MATEVQMVDRGALVKLFGATIHVAPPPATSAVAAGGTSTSPAVAAAAAWKTDDLEALQKNENEYYTVAAGCCCARTYTLVNHVLHNDKKVKLDDDVQRFKECQPPHDKSEEQSGSSTDEREEEVRGEEEKEDCGETDENKDKKQQDDKASLTKKKPDKVLPCPRCESMDTKFCYYNNYNVNQPRHFCRECQRYWTAGGAVRPNMPIGAGKRKKPSRGGGGGGRYPQQDEEVVMVLESVVSPADHAAAAAMGDGDGAILSFADGMASPPSNYSNNKQRLPLSAVTQVSLGANCQVAAPHIPWPIKGAANPPLYFYGGNPPAPAAPAVVPGIGVANGYAPAPQPVHLCWMSAAAAAGWHVYSVVPWAPHMPSYHPTTALPPLIPTSIPVRSHSHSDADCLSFGSSVVEDSLSRQSSSSLETSPRAKGAAKKRSSPIREVVEEEDEEVGACQSYQIRTKMSGHRTEAMAKVLHSNPAAMMRSFSFQETA